MSVVRHSDAGFETVVEAHLLQNGYVSVAGEALDRDHAVFPRAAEAVTREAQPEEWAELESLHRNLSTTLRHRRLASTVPAPASSLRPWRVGLELPGAPLIHASILTIAMTSLTS